MWPGYLATDGQWETVSRQDGVAGDWLELESKVWCPAGYDGEGCASCVATTCGHEELRCVSSEVSVVWVCETKPFFNKKNTPGPVPSRRQFDSI